MAENRSLDVAGIGKFAEAIPDEAWNQIVETACATFKEVVAPITATTGGLGRLITAKFDLLTDPEKLLASQTIQRANEKASNSKRKRKTSPNPTTICKVIEASSSETDATLNELWTNLLANEMVDNSCHPEFIRVLSRLSSTDAHRLIELAQRSSPPKMDKWNLRVFGVEIRGQVDRQEPLTFTNTHLSNLGLIERPEISKKEGGKTVNKIADYYVLSVFGKAFMEAISNPSHETSQQDVNENI